ncbi:MAG: hypothetical protein WDZ26_04300 [Nitriliruptoraceae bacterium]
MLDSTPAPFGDVTRCWTHLGDGERDRHVDRLLGDTCTGDLAAHVDAPSLDGGACYLRLVSAALAGDPVGIGWLAACHRPLLLARGRALFEHDATEWGAVCLEVLYRTLAKADLSEACWLRRRVARQLTHRVGRLVAQHLHRRDHERPFTPDELHPRQDAVAGHAWDDQSNLRDDLDRALAQVDGVAREALFALADQEPLYDVASRHGMSYPAVRQRVSRARKTLRPELASYRRVAV